MSDLAEKRIYVERFYAETSVAQSKLRLLVKDDNIISLSHKLLLALLQFKAWMDMRLLSLQQNLESHNSLTERFLIIIKDYEANKEVAKGMAADEKRIQEGLKTITKEFYENRTEEFKKILPIDNSFTQLVKDYLTQ